MHNVTGWTPLMVARSWHRDWLEEILSTVPENWPQLLPSPYLCLPLMSIVKIYRECGWRSSDSTPAPHPCVVCLERKCTIAAEGCDREFCTCCAMYLCSTKSTSTVAHGPPSSIACPLCRHGIVSFVKLLGTGPLIKDIGRTSLSLSFCSCSTDVLEATSLETPLCKPGLQCARISPLGSSFRSLSCQGFPSVKLNSSLCMGAPETSPSLVRRTSADRNLRNNLARCSRSGFRRSASHSESRRLWFLSLNQYVVTGS